MTDYRNKCGSCTKMDINNRSGYNCYCKKRAAYYSVKDDRICYAYEYDEERDYIELDRVEELNKTCYITTIMCEIMHLPDNNPYLNTLRSFRDDVLQKDSKYYNLLLEYDTIGPVIANELRHDKDNLRIVKGLIINYFSPIVIYIEYKRFDEAVLLYKRMVESLKEMYGINGEIKEVENYDATVGGHGYVLTKENKLI